MVSTKHILTAAVLGSILSTGALAQSVDTQSILERYAADYVVNDVTFTADEEFGVEVNGEMWTVTLTHADRSYSVTAGTPSTPTFYYTATGDILERIDRGEISAYTSMAKAFSTDVTPMDIELMDGADFDPSILTHVFHFWTRGFPEVVNYDQQDLRFVHGGNAGIIYYQPGFRSGFGAVSPGQHVNEDPRSRTNPFPTLIICVEGQMTARINGQDTEFSEGQFMIIPAEVSHEFLNPYDEDAHFFLFMFGEGA
ncbi:cupin domain-containing protein [Hyphobacterium sp. HN65]|uniref:Cupin domain-containing protein n=1 Tax=Hyphobacterium lacteum TaxID=3116575 RepID=A0ABU7LPZ6_9PROT|nr:cupin domain-containing protein [Hyphobacterium sp. HN65]MEE2525977.1 cupin domain-containing protein [Hyphobacterium sp. HN65]